MSILRLRNPIAETVEQTIEPAPRPGDLDGKRIGLYWNMKGGGDVALAHAQKRLGERYPGARFSHYQGSVGFIMRHCTPADADRIAKEVDAVIGTTSD
jgi:hypothetical protein